jgi:hypothetical protein
MERFRKMENNTTQKKKVFIILLLELELMIRPGEVINFHALDELSHDR